MLKTNTKHILTDLLPGLAFLFFEKVRCRGRRKRQEGFYALGNFCHLLVLDDNFYVTCMGITPVFYIGPFIKYTTFTSQIRDIHSRQPLS